MCSTKVCNKCGIGKDIELFFKDRGACKDCVLISNRKYYQENKEKIREQGKKYRQRIKKLLAERNSNFYQENKENILRSQKKYYQENKEKIVETRKKYRQDNKEKIANGNKKYRQENRDKIMYARKKYYQENVKHYAIYNFLAKRGIKKDNISIELSDTIVYILEANRKLRNHV